MNDKNEREKIIFELQELAESVLSLKTEHRQKRPTSALDQHSENIVHDAIKEIGRDKTIIIVSHRKSSISICDNVIEMRS